MLSSLLPATVIGIAILVGWQLNLRARIRRQLDDPEVRARYVRELREDRFLPGPDGERRGEASYRQRMVQVLAVLDRLLGRRRWFDLRGVGVCVAFSLAYASLFFLAGWIVGNGSDMLSLRMLPDEVPSWRRALAGVTLIVALVLPQLEKQPRTGNARAVQGALGLVSAGVLFAVVHRILLERYPWQTPDERSSELAVLFVASLVGTWVASVSLRAALRPSDVGRSMPRGGPAFALAFVLLGAATFVAPGLWPGVRAVETVGLFVVVLPACNALFDWLSWAISRSLMHHLLARPATIRRLLMHGVADLLAAVALLTGLAVLVPLLIEGGRLGVASQELIGEVLGDPLGAGLWVVVMLVSTLLPTVLHLAVLIGSALNCHHPAERREAVAGQLTTTAGVGPDARDKDDVAAYLSTRWLRGVGAALVLCIGIGLVTVNSGTPFARALADAAWAVGQLARSDATEAAILKLQLRRGLPDARSTHAGRGEMCLHALASYRRWYAKTAEDAELHVLAATCAHAIGQHAQALMAAEEALRHDPQHADGRHMRAFALFGLGEHQEAVEAIQALRDDRPDDPHYCVDHAYLLARADDSEGALGVLEPCLMRWPDEAALLQTRRDILAGRIEPQPPRHQ